MAEMHALTDELNEHAQERPEGGDIDRLLKHMERFDTVSKKLDRVHKRIDRLNDIV